MNFGFFLRVILSAVIISFASGLAGRKPALAGFIIALPLVSMLSILFSYLQYRDVGKVSEFAKSILVAVPLSLLFFVPFLLNKWLKMSFPTVYLLGVLCLSVAYLIHRLILKMI